MACLHHAPLPLWRRKLPEHGFFLQKQEQLPQIFSRVHLHDRFARRELICRTEQEAYGKNTGFNSHHQPSAHATHAAPPETPRRIRCGVSHSGRGQRGGQIREETVIEGNNSNSSNRGCHRGRDIGVRGVIEEEDFSRAATVFRASSGFTDSKVFLEICGMRNEQQPF